MVLPWFFRGNLQGSIPMELLWDWESHGTSKGLHAISMRFQRKPGEIPQRKTTAVLVKMMHIFGFLLCVTTTQNAPVNNYFAEIPVSNAVP